MSTKKKYLCEGCESEVRMDSKFCGHCGAQLIADAKVPPIEEATSGDIILNEVSGKEYDVKRVTGIGLVLEERDSDREHKVIWRDLKKNYVIVRTSDSVKDAEEVDTDIDNEEDFKKYAEKVLKEAFGEDYDEDEAEDFIEDLIEKVKDGKMSWGEAVGVVQSSIGDDVEGVTINGKERLQKMLKTKDHTDNMKWSEVKSYSMSSKKGGGMQLTFVMKDGHKHSVDVDKKDAEKWSQLSTKEKAKMAEKYHEKAAEKEKDYDSVQDAGFKNKKARSVVEILKGAPGMTDEKARALLMYHGNLTSLQRARSSRDVLRFKALKEMMSEDEVDELLNYLKDRKNKKRDKKKENSY